MNNNKNKLKIIAVVLIVFSLLSGCSNNASDSSESEVTLLITRDFGNEVIFSADVTIKKDATVIDVMEENITVETKYNGSFINSINGLESNYAGNAKEKFDWFYYINGVCADVGGNDYYLNDGDKIWWDYHTWGKLNSANSSVVGQFPEPFINGYRENNDEIVILGSVTNINEKLEVYFTEHEEKVTVKTIENKSIENRDSPTILIDEWEKIKDLKYINKLNKNYKKTGAFFYFENNKILLTDENKEVKRTVAKSASIIFAIGEGLGDENPLWIITGTDSKSIENAVDILIKRPEELNGLINCVIIDGEIVRLPIVE